MAEQLDLKTEIEEFLKWYSDVFFLWYLIEHLSEISQEGNIDVVE